jgi:hypothetical protein
VGDLAKPGAEGSIELASAFCGISDRRVRRTFLDLARTIVAAQNGDGAGLQSVNGACILSAGHIARFNSV